MSQNPVAPEQVPGTSWNVGRLISLQELTGRAGTDKKGLGKEIKELRAAIPLELLRLFDRAIEHGREAIARVSESGACGGCHLMLPSGMAAKVRVLTDEVHKCPYCGRFLYFCPVPLTATPSGAPLPSSKRPRRSSRVLRSGHANRSNPDARTSQA